MDNDLILVLTVMFTSTAITLTALFVFQDVLMIADDGGMTASSASTNAMTVSQIAAAVAATSATGSGVTSGDIHGAMEDDVDDVTAANDIDDADGDFGLAAGMNLANAFLDAAAGANNNIGGDPGNFTSPQAAASPVQVTTTIFQDGEAVFEITSLAETMGSREGPSSRVSTPSRVLSPTSSASLLLPVGTSSSSSGSSTAATFSSDASASLDHAHASVEGMITAHPIADEEEDSAVEEEDAAPLHPQHQTLTQATVEVGAAPRPPARLIRRDSSQGDDHNMTCLHFFAITNRPAGDFTQVLSETTEDQLSVNARVRYLHLSALHFAAMNASVDAIRELLRHGANPDAQDALGKTPLRHAAMLRRGDAVTCLLKEGGARDKPDVYGCSALRYSLLRNHPDVVAAYVQARPSAANAIIEGGSIDKADPMHRPLHVAANAGFDGIVKLLLEHGALADGEDSVGRTPLMYAAIQGHVMVARILFGFDAENDSETTLDAGGVDSILRDGYLRMLFNPNKSDANKVDSYGPELVDGKKGSVRVDEQDEEENRRDEDETKFRLSPFHLAIRGPKKEALPVVSFLVEHGVDITAPVPIEVEGWISWGFAWSWAWSWIEWLSIWALSVKNTALWIMGRRKLDISRKRRVAGAEKKNPWKRTVVDPITGQKKDITVVHVSPVAFALAAGQLDVARYLLDLPSELPGRESKTLLPWLPRFWNMGLSQFILAMVVAVGAKRWDVAWRIVMRTPVGLLVLIIALTVAFVRVAIFTTPSITQELMKEAWEICFRRRGE
ncbi:hypothetical protein HDU96_011133 [Phlyctochytrium bullatum]|nr:hypothetical protein HDU96_011133 [Phlyctochytrium bullatum]